jgi:hypothetical protein
MVMRSILDMFPDEIEPPPTYAPTIAQRVVRREEEWVHPTSEADRLIDLEQFLAKDFLTYREIKVEHHSYTGRIDLLAIPKISELGDVALAFEVKGASFGIERALKQSADYVGGRVFGGPHRNKHIAACFLYPIRDPQLDNDRYHLGVFNLIAHWRVGRAYVRRGALWLAIGQEVVWDSRGWHETVANRMLLSKRTVCGSRREFNHVEMNGHELRAVRRY